MVGFALSLLVDMVDDVSSQARTGMLTVYYPSWVKASCGGKMTREKDDDETLGPLAEKMHVVEGVRARRKWREGRGEKGRGGGEEGRGRLRGCQVHWCTCEPCHLQGYVLITYSVPYLNLLC